MAWPARVLNARNSYRAIGFRDMSTSRLLMSRASSYAERFRGFFAPSSSLSRWRKPRPRTKLHWTMAQTKRKRRTKHRGTAAGTIQTRGRTGRPPSPEERKNQDRMQARERRLNKPPSWRRSAGIGVFAAVALFLLFSLTGRGKTPVLSAAFFALFAAAIYIPGGYYMELYMYRRRQRRNQQAGK